MALGAPVNPKWRGCRVLAVRFSSHSALPCLRFLLFKSGFVELVSRSAPSFSLTASQKVLEIRPRSVQVSSDRFPGWGGGSKRAVRSAKPIRVHSHAQTACREADAARCRLRAFTRQPRRLRLAERVWNHCAGAAAGPPCPVGSHLAGLCEAERVGGHDAGLTRRVQ